MQLSRPPQKNHYKKKKRVYATEALPKKKGIYAISK